MAEELFTPDGQPSWDGVNPKIIQFKGFDFGHHKAEKPCIACKTPTRWGLHRKYKFSMALEKKEEVDRIWCCSETCFQKAVFMHMFDLIIPQEDLYKIIGPVSEENAVNQEVASDKK